MSTTNTTARTLERLKYDIGHHQDLFLLKPAGDELKTHRQSLHCANLVYFSKR